MDTQEKLLNEQYLGALLNEIREIKNKEVLFNIEQSDRAFSKTLYIHFYCQSTNRYGKWYKCSTLRVSDHLQNGCRFGQFIIKPDKSLKNVKRRFLAQVTRVVKLAQKRSLFKLMDNLSKQNRNIGN